MTWELPVLLLGALVGLVGAIWLIVVAFKTSNVWGVALLVTYLSGFLAMFAPLLGVLSLVWLILFVVFSVKYWRYAKVPALIVIVSFFVQIGSVAGLLMKGQSMVQSAQQQMQSGDMQDEDLRRLVLGNLLGQEPADTGEAPQDEPAQTAAPADNGEQDANQDGSEPAQSREAAAADDTGQQPPADAPQAEPRITRPLQPDPLAIKPPPPDAPATRPVAVSSVSGYLGEYFFIEDVNGVRHEGRLRRIRAGALEFERRVHNGTFSFELPVANIKRLRLRLEDPEQAS